MMAEIDYRLRPSKGVQRQMIIDACRRLTPFAPLTDYQYVGFGGLDFVDFDLVHRALGITVMTSIEADLSHIERYSFNRPFKSIRLVPGHASDNLAALEWDRLSIVWLDYECRLDDEVISDVTLLCGRLQPGSALFVTINAHPQPQMAERRADLAAKIGEQRIPVGVTDESLAIWGLAAVQHQVLSDITVGALRNRPVRADWRQILRIRYADGQRMQTLGGVVVAPGSRQTFENCRFSDLDFVCFAGDAPLLIRVPVLTAKERRVLEEQLPIAPGENLDAPWLPGKDLDAYLRVYRYCRSGQFTI